MAPAAAILMHGTPGLPDLDSRRSDYPSAASSTHEAAFRAQMEIAAPEITVPLSLD